MSIELRILGGARSGYAATFHKSVIAIGRHPMSDLKFDPKQDLDVSTRHGEIRYVDGRYTIYDAQSTNGTFVNGHRVTPGGVKELNDNDVIAFGAQGPKVTVRIAGKAKTPHTPPQAPDTHRAGLPTAYSPARKRTTGERVAIAVKEQTQKLRIAIVIVIVVLGGGAAGVALKSVQAANASRAQMEQLIADHAKVRQELLAKLPSDSVLIGTLRRRSDSLERIARDARGAQQAPAAEQLRLNHDLQLKFNAMDPTSIVASNAKAIVLITTQVGGKPNEATGFVVSPSGLVVTNRHVVLDSLGNRASRIFVKLAKNSGTRRAHVVRVATDSSVDLALLQIDGAGPFSAVRGVATSVDAAAGAAILTLGFPYGTDLPMEDATVDPSLTMGTVSRAIKDLLQIDSFASKGASGSPVFDSHGHVIGVVWGGQKDAGGRIVYAVPADRITELVRAGR